MTELLPIASLIAKAKSNGHAMTISSERLDRRAVIDALLDDVGPGASVDLVSWTIGKEDCIWLEQAVNRGRIGRLRIIADVSTRAKTPDRYDPLARIGQVIDIGDVHAKASIIEAADGSIAFAEVTSANLNKNRRAESWTLSTDRGVIADLRASIEKLQVGVLAPTLQSTPAKPLGHGAGGGRMTELIPIPYLAPEDDATYRLLPAEIRQRLISAAQAVARDELGYKRAVARYQLQEVQDLLRAIAQPVRSREQAAPWDAPALEPTSQQQLLPPTNMLPLVDGLVEQGVVGSHVLAEYMRDGRLTPMQVTAVMLLALGEPAYKVAEKLGVERMTVYAWRRLPAFQEASAVVVQERVEALIAKLDEAQTLALQTLIDQLEATNLGRDGNHHPDNAARIRAAEALLDRGGRVLKANRLELTAGPAREEQSLDARIAAILAEEERLEAELRESSEPLTVIEGGRVG